jgi:hypothetical protein
MNHHLRPLPQVCVCRCCEGCRLAANIVFCVLVLWAWRMTKIQGLASFCATLTRHVGNSCRCVASHADPAGIGRHVHVNVRIICLGPTLHAAAQSLPCYLKVPESCWQTLPAHAKSSDAVRSCADALTDGSCYVKSDGTCTATNCGALADWQICAEQGSTPASCPPGVSLPVISVLRAGNQQSSRK